MLGNPTSIRLDICRRFVLLLFRGGNDMHKSFLATALFALTACQPASLEEAAVEKAIEIVEAEIPGVQNVALTDVAITADESYQLQVCATASAANLPPRQVIAQLGVHSLMPDPLMRLMEVTGGFDDECGADARRRFYTASPDQMKHWLEKL